MKESIFVVHLAPRQSRTCLGTKRDEGLYRTDILDIPPIIVNEVSCRNNDAKAARLVENLTKGKYTPWKICLVSYQEELRKS